jgi:hypothetical protein
MNLHQHRIPMIYFNFLSRSSWLVQEEGEDVSALLKFIDDITNYGIPMDEVVSNFLESCSNPVITEDLREVYTTLVFHPDRPSVLMSLIDEAEDLPPLVEDDEGEGAMICNNCGGRGHFTVECQMGISNRWFLGIHR